MVAHGYIDREHFLPSPLLRTCSDDGGILAFSVFFQYDNPRMQFAYPVLLATREGVSFTTWSSLAMMRDSPNQNLAWEFMRFVLEFEYSLYVHRVPTGYQRASTSLPVNRNRFENQVGALMGGIYDNNMDSTDLAEHISLPIEVHREQSIAYALTFFRDSMEQLNFQKRMNIAVFNSLVFPDIMLLHTGQQDVERTLHNIQNRLELYVHE